MIINLIIQSEPAYIYCVQTDALKKAIQGLVHFSEQEMRYFLTGVSFKKLKRNEVLVSTGQIPQYIYFINYGGLRVVLTDNNGVEHTLHFAIENQFIASYTGFILQQPSAISIEAFEPTEVAMMPRDLILNGYENIKEGNKLGRLIAEYYFIYQDTRIRNLYALTPKQRYDMITSVFPNIHNRVPQHMIASYLGITPVHLSRLKKSTSKKI